MDCSARIQRNFDADFFAGPVSPDMVESLDIALQPIVNIHTGACYGYEALLRGTHEAGYGSIQDFFDLAHAMGVLADVEMILREKALLKFVAMTHYRQAKLFINVDNRALGQAGELTRRTSALLDRLGLDESLIVFEISEHHSMGTPEEASAALAEYKRANYRLAIDDFGTGFSGLQMLYFAEPDFLKIDRFFVSDIATDTKKKLFLSQIVNIAHLLGVVVLAEGIETEREYFVCKDIGCDLIQGYMVQHPTCDVSAMRARYESVADLGQCERRSGASDQKIIGEQITIMRPISLKASMPELFERFRSDKAASFIPVVDEADEPVGIVREKDLKDYAYSPFGKELMSNKKIGRRLKDIVVRCPMADINTKAEHILQAYSAVSSTEGIVIVENMKYVGFLSAHSLLRVINEKNLAAARDQNPLTKLPGNNLIHEYVSKTLGRTETEYVLAYFDFDNFKPFNDTYGFRLGDRAILLFGELLSKALPRETTFAGHVGGDDFFAGFRAMDFEAVTALCREVIETFSRDVQIFYDDETRQRGHIDGQDRQGNSVEFPLMTVSAALIQLMPGRRLHSVDEIGEMIAHLKKEAKKAPDHLCAGTLVK